MTSSFHLELISFLLVRKWKDSPKLSPYRTTIEPTWVLGSQRPFWLLHTWLYKYHGSLCHLLQSIISNKKNSNVSLIIWIINRYTENYRVSELEEPSEVTSINFWHHPWHVMFPLLELSNDGGLFPKAPTLWTSVPFTLGKLKLLKCFFLMLRSNLSLCNTHPLLLNRAL